MARSSNLPSLFSGEINPLREMSRLQRRIDRLFEGLLDPGFDLRGAGFNPPVEVEEKDNSFEMYMDLPGVKKDDLKIDLNDNVLMISGERKEERKEEKEGRQYSERYYGTFQRSFTLPSNVDAEKVQASYKDGVLCLSIPKAEQTKGRRIEISETTASKSLPKGKTSGEEHTVLHTSGGEMPDTKQKVGKTPLTKEDAKKAS